MIKNLLIKIKVITKRLIGKTVYIFTCLKNKSNTFYTQLTKKKLKSKILPFLKQWKTSSFLLICLLFLYYAIGAFVSSNINNKLDIDIKTDTTLQHHATTHIIHTLKSQIDDTPWTPSLPLIFPASILDNLPNFQLGTKNASKYIIKRMSALYLNTSLKEASQLLDYPANIWLFSQNKDDKLSPGSAKQYRKAINHISEFSKTENIHHPLNINNLSFHIESINNLLSSTLNTINKHTIEHCSDFIDNKSDDVFFYTQGNLYTVYYFLSGLAKDYQDFIVEKDIYNEVTSSLKNINTAIKLNPTIIKNSPPENAYSANHLLYLAYYTSLALNHIKNIHNIVKQQTSRIISNDN